MRADLRAEPEHEAAARERLQILRESTRVVIGLRAKATAIAVASVTESVRSAREGERDERIVLPLEAPEAREPLCLQLLRLIARGPLPADERCIDLHGVRRICNMAIEVTEFNNISHY